VKYPAAELGGILAYFDKQKDNTRFIVYRLAFIVVTKQASLPFDNAQGLEFIERPLPKDETLIFYGIYHDRCDTLER